MLSRDELLNAKARLPFEAVDVPELGGKVGVQGMTAGDAIDFYAALSTKGGGGLQDKEATARMLTRCIVGENRERIFTDDEWEVLLGWPNAALQRIFDASLRVNKSPSAGNSETPHADGSSSA